MRTLRWNRFYCCSDAVLSGAADLSADRITSGTQSAQRRAFSLGGSGGDFLFSPCLMSLVTRRWWRQIEQFIFTRSGRSGHISHTETCSTAQRSAGCSLLYSWLKKTQHFSRRVLTSSSELQSIIIYFASSFTAAEFWAVTGVGVVATSH